MSGLTSTISDSGRVYLFDRNALPKNFIESGLKMSPSGLAVNVTPGTCDISGKYHELAEVAILSLPQRMACMPYALKSDLTDTPTFGYVQAAFPAADAGTVNRWIIDGSATIASTAGSNDLTRSGTVTQVDGWIGYAGQGDGSTGYYTSANYTGFPTGASARQITILYTVRSSAATQCLFSYGGTGAAQGFILTQNGLRLVMSDGSTTRDSGFDVEVGKTYLIDWIYDGTTLSLYVNGTFVYAVAATLATTAGVANIFRWNGGRAI